MTEETLINTANDHVRTTGPSKRKLKVTSIRITTLPLRNTFGQRKQDRTLTKMKLLSEPEKCAFQKSSMIQYVQVWLTDFPGNDTTLFVFWLDLSPNYLRLRLLGNVGAEMFMQEGPHNHDQSQKQEKHNTQLSDHSHIEEDRLHGTIKYVSIRH